VTRRRIEADPTTAKYRAPALEKGLDVLELLAARGKPLTRRRSQRRSGGP